jgi:hypothetical protein
MARGTGTWIDDGWMNECMNVNLSEIHVSFKTTNEQTKRSADG